MRERLATLWSATGFAGPELSAYAQPFILKETRRGLMHMALLSICLHLASAAFYLKLDFGWTYFYTYGALVLLSMHVLISARFVNEIRVLHLLGIVLLVITSLAFVLLAHNSGTLSFGLLVGIVLLLMVMPLVPWGLRETLCVIGLVYALMTLSMLSVKGRFDQETLWTLQFVILAAAAITAALVARNVRVRKDDILARFDLETSHKEMERLSLVDPLTGAWNRRFLDENYDGIAERFRHSRQRLHFVLIDIDDFKRVNDAYGHHHGDLILERLVEEFAHHLGAESWVIRLGGDEFACLFGGGEPQAAIDAAERAVRSDAKLFESAKDEPVSMSIGLVTVPPDQSMDLESLYRRADAVMYGVKRQRSLRRRSADRRGGPEPRPARVAIED